MNTMTLSEPLSVIASQVASKLAIANTRGESAIITTPVLAYGHTFIPVTLTRHGNGLMVSDQGFARREVGMHGGDRFFMRSASKVAPIYGVRCDGDIFYTTENAEDLDAIISAVAAVANTVKDVIETVVERLANRAEDDTREQIDRVLHDTFGEKVRTGSAATLTGAKFEWDFDAVVETGEHPLAVLVISPYAASVNSAFSKFSDLRNRPKDAPRGIGVITADKIPRLALLTDVARIVPAATARRTETWLRLAA